jgi:pimeloyl-ACP methyl ester carboxylesterase
VRPPSRAALSRDTAALVGPQYQFELLPSAGHYLAEEAPERVTDLLLTWLRTVAPV